MPLNFALESAAIRNERHTIEFSELWTLTGSHVASVKRLLSSASDGPGIPPSNLYASGLTDLRVIPGASFLGQPSREATPYPTMLLRWLEFFNIELSKSDLIILDSRKFNIIELTAKSPPCKSYEITGDSFTLSGGGPPAPLALACGLSVKPSGSVTFKLTYIDSDSVSRISDSITFPADCKLQDHHPIMTSGVQLAIAQVTSVIETSGTMGAGSIYLSAHLPFQSHCLLAETS